MQETLITAIVSMMLIVHSPAVVQADGMKTAQAPATAEKGAADQKTGAAAPKVVGKGVAEGVRVRGTVAAVDKEKGTVTLKGPKGRTVTLEVRDRQKLDVIKVGDPVAATYMEAVVIQARKAGTAAPGVTTQETRISSKPGETPAGAIGREVTVTAAITALDKKAHTVTIKGPQGGTETIKAKDPKNLEALKVGDMVDITYAQALAVTLDKPAK